VRRRRWLAVAGSAFGMLLLAFTWLVLLGWAENLSADPGNAGAVVLLRSIVLSGVAVVLVGVSLLLPTRTRPVAGQLLPWAVWFLILLTVVFCATGGFY
jgi:hypothetical protein